MIFEKTFATAVILDDVAEIYTDNLDKVILNKLISIYEKKCFLNTFILKILEIEKRSNSIINTTNLDGTVKIDVVFRAKVITYEMLEIIHDCKMVSHDDTDIIAQNEYATITLLNLGKSIHKFIKDKFPVIVTSCMYTPGRDQISVIGEFLRPSVYIIKLKEFNNWVVINPMEKHPELDAKLSMIDDEIKSLSKFNTAIVKYFKNNLLMPFSKGKIDRNTELKNISGYVSDKPLVVSFPTFLNYIDLKIAVSKKAIDEGKDLGSVENPYSMDAFTFYNNVFSTILLMIHNIKNMCKEYPDYKKYDNYWKLYNKYKQ